MGSSVEPYTVVAGNPAKVIRKRFDEELVGLLEAFRWWDKDTDTINGLIPMLTSGDLENVKAELKKRMNR